jgi:multiple sugar transport system ATP-binding protein
MTTVSIEKVWKLYGRTQAVKDLNIECADGSFLSILGPSGCGKSSTMRMIAGLEHITAGEIRFDGKRVNDIAPKDRDVAMVFENYALYPHKTVYDNIANPLKLRGQNEARIRDRVGAAAKLLEIGELLDRRPQELSGGQKQRVAIGRAIVREPKLFLFDEPIAHLDAKLRAHMRGEIKHMQRTLGTTMIYVTHDQLEAMSMADRIAVMHEGELQQLGTPREVYNKPVNAWVAGFVGEPAMNFVDCRIEETDGKIRFAHPNFNISVTPAQAALLAASLNSDAVRMGVRPDALSISLARPMDEHITGKIFVTELLGGDMIIDVDLADERIRVKTSTDFDGKEGDTCFILANRNKWHAFSNETGRAIF